MRHQSRRSSSKFRNMKKKQVENIHFNSQGKLRGAMMSDGVERQTNVAKKCLQKHDV